MSQGDVVVRFDAVSFEYGPKKLIMKEGSFALRQGAKFAVMGQNGAGKSTLFGLITGVLKPDEGSINIPRGLTIATARQAMPRGELNLTVQGFFEKCFSKKVYDIDPKIDAVLEVMNLHAPHDRLISSFSGGQQARLLLASALIQEPDVLLLDEPTNNLDAAGIAHLRQFLIDYPKTCMVISHDADFLNAFTEGVLYLDAFTQRLEHYAGNYFDVVAQITARIEKENRANAQLAKKIQENKDKANRFAFKGGQMRLVAKRMREEAAELEEEKVVVRKEDRAIRRFTIPAQEDSIGEIVGITSFSIIKNHKPVKKTVAISLKRRQHLLLKGQNGIGKSTLLESIAKGIAKGSRITEGTRVGYYRQDFSTLNFDDTVHDTLMGAMAAPVEEEMRSAAAGFLITADMIRTKIGALSEGQKGLVTFARLVLQRPGLLMLDEPTNHMNFRHIPVIAEALNRYEGAMILVSHVPEFVAKIRIDEVLDLEKE
ncbi:MAG: ATP-binding cassette domain-containing protein [bacterium]|nr:ATP-binding cassette domain-containing protein [bacterium]MDZ4299669.1 ATP-binding cassette domain-containing protein [Candidatus Sungbacteria bacterium]